MWYASVAHYSMKKTNKALIPQKTKLNNYLLQTNGFYAVKACIINNISLLMETMLLL